MSAERLREVAALMRSRAEALGHPQPWRVTEAEGGNRDQRRTLGTFSLIHSSDAEIALVRGLRSEREPIAEHVASWNPAVALAVADLLEEESHRPETPIGDGITLGGPSLTALRVANAYLSEQP